MFYDEVQHDDYLEVDPEAYISPNIRIMPSFLYGEVSEVASYADEHVLLVMHCNDAELLVISNQRVLIYKMPRTKSLARRAGGTAVSIATSLTIDAIPVVSDVSTFIGTAKTIKNRFWSKKEAGMPSKNEAKSTVWDLNDEQICLIVLCYRDRILLENSFGWKTTLEIPMKRVLKKRANISIETDKISFKIGGKKTSISRTNPNIDFVAVAQALVIQNGEALETAGWQADLSGESLRLKK